MKKIIFLFLLSLLVFTGCAKEKNTLKNTLDQTTSQKPILQNKQEVTITLDKNSYNKNETINITINNGLEKDIFYYPGGDRIWNIEYYENNEWKIFGYENRTEFQLTNEKIDADCYTILYELSPPITLKSKSGITTNWNQKICPFQKKYGEPETVQNINSGKYRLTFHFGFELHNDNQSIIEPKIIYSNDFVIL